MRRKIVVARTVSVNESGHRYRQGRIGTKALRVVFDATVAGDPENIPHYLLRHLIGRSEANGRVVDVFEPWSTTLAHRLVAVTDVDLAELPSNVEGNHD